MHRAALKRIVVVFAVRGNAVDERGIGRSEAAGMPDRGAASLALDALQCRSNIVGGARGNAESGDVEN